MKPTNARILTSTQTLHDLGQCLWLDNITRDLLTSGTLNRYIDEVSVPGLTSSPTIFDHAIRNSAAYDGEIREEIAKGKTREGLFFNLALDDLTRAADLFRPIYNRTNGLDGWVSLEVSPLLAPDTISTIAAAKQLFGQAGRSNLFIKIPGSKEGLPAIEEAIFAGMPVNVTLLFSRDQYVEAADAYLRGIERRIAAALNPQVGSVASIFISCWDAAVAGKVPQTLNNRPGIAIAGRIYKAYLDLLGNPRCQRAYNAGARPQRLLWASAQGPRTPMPPTPSTSRPIHGEHDAGGNVESFRRSQRHRPDYGGGRRRLPSGFGTVTQSRHQSGSPGRGTSDGSGARPGHSGPFPQRRELGAST